MERTEKSRKRLLIHRGIKNIIKRNRLNLILWGETGIFFAETDDVDDGISTLA